MEGGPAGLVVALPSCRLLLMQDGGWSAERRMECRITFRYYNYLLQHRANESGPVDDPSVNWRFWGMAS